MKKRKELRVERFLSEMERVVPWGKLVEEIRPYYMYYSRHNLTFFDGLDGWIDSILSPHATLTGLRLKAYRLRLRTY